MKNVVKEIITDIDELSVRCDEIDPRKEGKEVREIVLALKETMKAKDLTSLTAPQIGFKKRIFCVKFGKDDYRSFVNPVVSNQKNFTFAREKCSSIPNTDFIRPRFGSIQIIYMTPLGKIESRDVIGKSSFLFQHCIDHLDGLLLSDVGLEVDELFDQATDEERAEVLKAYAESLDIKQKELKKQIEEDKDAKQISDAIDFIESVNKGETKLEKLD